MHNFRSTPNQLVLSVEEEVIAGKVFSHGTKLTDAALDYAIQSYEQVHATA